MRTTDALVDFLASPQPTTRWTVDPRGQIATSNEVSIWRWDGGLNESPFEATKGQERWYHQYLATYSFFSSCSDHKFAFLRSIPHAVRFPPSLEGGFAPEDLAVGGLSTLRPLPLFACVPGWIHSCLFAPHSRRWPRKAAKIDRHRLRDGERRTVMKFFVLHCTVLTFYLNSHTAAGPPQRLKR